MQNTSTEKMVVMVKAQALGNEKKEARRKLIEPLNMKAAALKKKLPAGMIMYRMYVGIGLYEFKLSSKLNNSLLIPWASILSEKNTFIALIALIHRDWMPSRKLCNDEL